MPEPRSSVHERFVIAIAAMAIIAMYIKIIFMA